MRSVQGMKKERIRMDRSFEEAARDIQMAEVLSSGIGTLSEKSVHAVLKRYLDPDPSHQEVPLLGYICDIFDGKGITEIQTANFQVLNRKLDVFLPEYPVEVVHPIPHSKTLMWIDPETGEVSKPRKVSKKGTVYDAFRELYRIRTYLGHPNLRVSLFLIDLEEYRFLDGWSRDRKRGSHRAERIPTALYDVVSFSSADDYRQLIPDSLDDVFTAAQFRKAAKVSDRAAGSGIALLMQLSLVERIGKEGRAYLYRRCQ